MRSNYRNTSNHAKADYSVTCFDCGVEVGHEKAHTTLTSDVYLCRVCYLAYVHHNMDSVIAKGHRCRHCSEIE